jgi:hypothetical protein
VGEVVSRVGSREKMLDGQVKDAAEADADGV